MYLVGFFTLIFIIFIIFLVLQNFADAGRALYRVARKYASKVNFSDFSFQDWPKEKVYHWLYHSVSTYKWLTKSDNRKAVVRCLITSTITVQIGWDEVLLPINHNYYNFQEIKCIIFKWKSFWIPNDQN